MAIDEQISNLKEIGLYLFNANLRQLIFPEIEKIEINVRCCLLYTSPSPRDRG